MTDILYIHCDTSGLADRYEVLPPGRTDGEEWVQKETLQTVVQRAARDARDVFSEHRDAKDAVDYMEQLIYAAIRARVAALKEPKP